MSRKMKDSGVEWIGEIPEEWEIRKLASISKTITDFVASGSFASLNENVKYIDTPDYAMLVRTVDLSNSSNTKKVYIDKHAYEFLANSNLFGGELVLSNIGSVGNVFLYEPLYERASLAPNAIMMRMKESNRFYYYWLLSPLVNNALKRLGSNAVQAKFNKTQLRQFLVARPSLKEQSRIANYLDIKVAEIDHIIAKTQASIEEYKRYKQSIITEAVTKGLDPNVPMKDSGIEWIGEIPEDWEITSVKSKYRLVTGFTPDTENPNYYDDNGYVWVNISDLSNDRYIVDSKKKISDLAIKECKGNLIKKGSLLYSFKLSVGQVSFAGNDLYTNEAIASFIEDESINLNFFYYMSSFAIIQNANENIYGAKLLNQQLIKNAKIVFPPLNEQQKIANFLDKKVAEIDHIISKKEQLINNLESYKKSLIYEVVTGKKEVI